MKGHHRRSLSNPICPDPLRTDKLWVASSSIRNQSTVSLLVLLKLLRGLRHRRKLILTLLKLRVLQVFVLAILQIDEVRLEVLLLLELGDVLINEVIPLLLLRRELVRALPALLHKLVREVLRGFNGFVVVVDDCRWIPLVRLLLGVELRNEDGMASSL